jgi:LPS sulfotransferase NodH
MTAHNYVVMTYARCGATWLAQLLGSTNSLGRPEDWFNGEGYRKRGVADYPLDRPGQLAKVFSLGRSDNGVIGLKLSPGRVDELAGFDWSGPLAPLRFIHLNRADRVARAISEVRAEQTGQWRSTTAPEGEPRYDARAIRAALVRHARGEARTRLYFALNGITPLELTYEELHADPEGAVARIAGFVGVALTAPPDHARVTLRVQRDATNDAWRARYLAEAAAPNALPSINAWRGLDIFQR